MKSPIAILVSILLAALLVASATTCSVEETAVVQEKAAEAEEASQPVEEIVKEFPAKLKRKDRAMGAIMGALIGDAMGVGSHWYYDPECFQAEFGWITDYVEPKVDSTCQDWADVPKQRVKDGVKKGGPSQDGQLMILLLESVAEHNKYSHDDYTSRLDELLKNRTGRSRAYSRAGGNCE